MTSFVICNLPRNFPGTNTKIKTTREKGLITAVVERKLNYEYTILVEEKISYIGQKKLQLFSLEVNFTSDFHIFTYFPPNYLASIIFY